MQKLRIMAFIISIIIPLALMTSCKKNIEKNYSSGCQQNLKETAVALMIYKEERGDYPNSLEELAQVVDFDQEFIHCLTKSGRIKFTYHKPPKDASPDFIILECPNHPKEFKYRLRNIGVTAGKKGDGPKSTTP